MAALLSAPWDWDKQPCPETGNHEITVSRQCCNKRLPREDTTLPQQGVTLD